jgi:hypothetical protein
MEIDVKVEMTARIRTINELVQSTGHIDERAAVCAEILNTINTINIKPLSTHSYLHNNHVLFITLLPILTKFGHHQGYQIFEWKIKW